MNETQTRVDRRVGRKSSKDTQPSRTRLVRRRVQTSVKDKIEFDIPRIAIIDVTQIVVIDVERSYKLYEGTRGYLFNTRT